MLKEENKKTAWTIAKAIILILGIVLVSYGAYRFFKHTTYSNTTNGRLSEIEDDVCVQTYDVHSNIPANNTTVAIVCINDQIYKISGHINMHITDETPSYTYTQTNIVNGDTLELYVPKGSIQRLDNQYAR